MWFVVALILVSLFLLLYPRYEEHRFNKELEKIYRQDSIERKQRARADSLYVIEVQQRVNEQQKNQKKKGAQQRQTTKPTKVAPSYHDRKSDNLRGWDPASEDDLEENGMDRYMENNDERGWD